MSEPDPVEAYREKFGSLPTLMGLPDHDKALQLLAQAVKEDKPFKTDAEWYAALGLDPPDPDALV